MHACVVINASVRKLLKYIECSSLMCCVNSCKIEKFDYYNALSP